MASQTRDRIRAAAEAAASELSRNRPQWWVAATGLFRGR